MKWQSASSVFCDQYQSMEKVIKIAMPLCFACETWLAETTIYDAAITLESIERDGLF